MKKGFRLVMTKEDMMEKTIYDLELHEIMEAKCGRTTFSITRVAGGWIYENIRLDRSAMTATFVPFNNEFQGNG